MYPQTSNNHMQSLDMDPGSSTSFLSPIHTANDFQFIKTFTKFHQDKRHFCNTSNQQRHMPTVFTCNFVIILI